jgi:hypothetical protein
VQYYYQDMAASLRTTHGMPVRADKESTHNARHAHCTIDNRNPKMGARDKLRRNFGSVRKHVAQHTSSWISVLRKGGIE